MEQKRKEQAVRDFLRQTKDYPIWETEVFAARFQNMAIALGISEDVVEEELYDG